MSDWKKQFPKDNIFYETENGILYCGNSEEILKNFSEKIFDVILTDPPYQYLKHKLDIPFDEDCIFNEFKRIINKNGLVVLFGRGTAFYRWNVKLNELGFKFKEELIWDKGNSTSPLLPISRIHETISIHQKGKKKLNKIYINKLEYDFNAGEWHRLANDMKRLIIDLKKIKSIDELKKWIDGEEKYLKKNRSNKHGITTNDGLKQESVSYKIYESYLKGILMKSIIRINREHYKFKHPTQKPIKLIEYLLKICSNENNLILDPFLGSGTTAVACEQLNRRWIGIEINPEYCDIAKQRIEEEIKIKKNKLKNKLFE